MNTKQLVITLLLVFGAFMVVPSFALESEAPGAIVNPAFDKTDPAEMAPSGTPALGEEKAMAPGYDLRAFLPDTSIYKIEHR